MFDVFFRCAEPSSAECEPRNVPDVSIKTALLCLDRISGSVGPGAPNEAIDADGDSEDRVLPVESLIGIAHQSGFPLRSATIDWHDLLPASTKNTVLLV